MDVTIVDIDDELLEQAQEVLGTRTAEETVNGALRELVARRRQTAALDELAALDLDLDAHQVPPASLVS